MLPGSQMLSTENLARYLQSTWVRKLRSSGPACDPVKRVTRRPSFLIRLGVKRRTQSFARM
ncbi:hypothetical protein PISMIDRAFT_672027, partial [Pisolithus microcarpus 441]